ncbi:MAG: hypothetical protein QXT73_06245 [Candidatus Methanomethylicaceae archaeon]
MKELLQLLLLLVIALATLVFFGPIIVMLTIIGKVELAHFKIDLTHLGRFSRIILGVIGFGLWIVVYVPLIWLLVKGNGLSPDCTPCPTPALCPTCTPYPTPTPELSFSIDPMETTTDWVQYTDAQGSTIVIGLVDGKVDKAFQISFALKEKGYVGISKSLIPCQLFGTRGIRFSYKGTGARNSVEVKLIYTPDGRGREAVFSVIKNQATDTNGKWVFFEALYSEFKCWPDTGCSAADSLDISRVQRIDFAISNKPDQRDVAGVGAVLIDEVQAFK